MPAISPEVRTVIWIVTGLAAFLFAILLIVLEANLAHLIRRLTPQLRREGGRPPSAKPLILWFLFFLSIGIAIIGFAIASSAPEQWSGIEEEVPTLSSILKFILWIIIGVALMAFANSSKSFDSNIRRFFQNLLSQGVDSGAPAPAYEPTVNWFIMIISVLVAVVGLALATLLPDGSQITPSISPETLQFLQTLVVISISVVVLSVFFSVIVFLNIKRQWGVHVSKFPLIRESENQFFHAIMADFDELITESYDEKKQAD